MFCFSVETEAEKVATDAIKALKRSKSECFRAASGIPSWTGLNGFKRAKRDDNADSSASLLNNIKSRHRLDDPSTSRDANDDDVSVSAEHQELLADLRVFIAAKARGQATTQEILDKFKRKLPNRNTPVFKALLHKLCEFTRKNNGTGVWQLKQEFM